jgi:hypothetical protein
VTKLSQFKASQVEPSSGLIKRNKEGNIDLDIHHAKTSEVQDEEPERPEAGEDEDEDENSMDDEEQKQRNRERERREAVKATFSSQRIKKFLWLIVTAFVISLYYGISGFFLNYIHEKERIYLDHYTLIGRKIQCYTSVTTFMMDSLSRNSHTSNDSYSSLAWGYLEDCFD